MSPVKPAIFSIIVVITIWLTFYALYITEVLPKDGMNTVLLVIGSLVFVSPYTATQKVKKRGHFSYGKEGLILVAAAIVVYVLEWIL